MDIINVLKQRYSTKEFDSTKQFTNEQIEQIEDLLQLSPSSTNIQPWHFVVASTKEGKERIAKAAGGFYAFNYDKVKDASAVVVFSSKVDLTQAYLTEVLDQEEKDGRFKEEEHKMQNHGGRSIFANMHKYDYKDFQQWADKQVYLNLGNFLLGVATLGIDAIALEGLDMKVLNEEFGLIEKGYTASFAVALGYRSANDFNADLPKSRLPKQTIITKV